MEKRKRGAKWNSSHHTEMSFSDSYMPATSSRTSLIDSADEERLSRAGIHLLCLHGPLSSGYRCRQNLAQYPRTAPHSPLRACGVFIHVLDECDG